MNWYYYVAFGLIGLLVIIYLVHKLKLFAPPTKQQEIFLNNSYENRRSAFRGLNSWEQNFSMDLSARWRKFSNRFNLSEKQSNVLDRIINKNKKALEKEDSKFIADFDIPNFKGELKEYNYMDTHVKFPSLIRDKISTMKFQINKIDENNLSKRQQKDLAELKTQIKDLESQNKDQALTQKQKKYVNEWFSKGSKSKLRYVGTQTTRDIMNYARKNQKITKAQSKYLNDQINENEKYEKFSQDDWFDLIDNKHEATKKTYFELRTLKRNMTIHDSNKAINLRNKLNDQMTDVSYSIALSDTYGYNRDPQFLVTVEKDIDRFNNYMRFGDR